MLFNLFRNKVHEKVKPTVEESIVIKHDDYKAVRLADVDNVFLINKAYGMGGTVWLEDVSFGNFKIVSGEKETVVKQLPDLTYSIFTTIGNKTVVDKCRFRYSFKIELEDRYYIKDGRIVEVRYNFIQDGIIYYIRVMDNDYGLELIIRFNSKPACFKEKRICFSKISENLHTAAMTDSSYRSVFDVVYEYCKFETFESYVSEKVLEFLFSLNLKDCDIFDTYTEIAQNLHKSIDYKLVKLHHVKFTESIKDAKSKYKKSCSNHPTKYYQWYDFLKRRSAKILEAVEHEE